MVGPLASNVIDSLPTLADATPIYSHTIVLGAITPQGIGCLISLIGLIHIHVPPHNAKVSFYTWTAPHIRLRGTSGFTAAGIIPLGSTASRVFSSKNM